MKILVINAGSSSLKYQLIDMEKESIIAKGNCERIGIDGKITHKTSDGRTISEDSPFPTHTQAFEYLTKVLTTGTAAVIGSMHEITAIGHRIVQGAEKFTESVIIDKDVIDGIEEVSDLAPLHNPAHILAIKACLKVFGDSIKQVAVFDTAFHQTMPEKAYIFPIPYEYYKKYHIRRYGFHGTSHRYVSQKYGEIVGNLQGTKIITCHLGNGSSITAIKDGKSVDTSMGFTPLDGITMGTRSGGIDPSVITYLAEKENWTPKQASDFMNKECGHLGLSGLTSDQRDLTQAAKEGDDRAQLALDIQKYQIKKFIGSYAAAMGGLDAVIFTGGIGENDSTVRRDICDGLEFLGIKVDESVNSTIHGTLCDVSAKEATTKVWVIPTDEELLIARDTKLLITK